METRKNGSTSGRAATEPLANHVTVEAAAHLAWTAPRTWFRSVGAPAAIRSEQITLADLARMIAQPEPAGERPKEAFELYALTQFRPTVGAPHGYRARENVEAVFAIVVDDDAAHLDLGQVVQHLEELRVRAFVHTTYSHDDEMPAYRLIIPLARPVTADEYDRLHALIRARLAELDHEIPAGAIDAARAWYQPVDRQVDGRRYRYAEVHGDLLDPDASAADAEEAWRAYRNRASKDAARETSAKAASGRPGDEWASATPWAEILHGWRLERERSGVGFWTRPGKQSGVSATTNYAGSGLLYMFSDAAPPFEPGQSYSKFAAFTMLEHGGDFGAAARALAEKGFGRREREEGRMHNLDEARRQRQRERERAKAQAEGATASEPEPGDEQEHDPMREALRAKFFDETMATKYLLEHDPPPREWAVEDLIPAREGGLIIGEGGAGKGHMQFRLGICITTGWNFGRFKVPRPGKVLMVSREDHRDELHRRLYAAIQVIDPSRLGKGEEWRARIEENLHLVDIRGLGGVSLASSTLREVIGEKIDKLGGVALVLLDPLGRLLPPEVQLNSQEGAACVHGAIDELVAVFNTAVGIAHHVSKAGRSTKPGEDRGAGASSGSHLLEDLARWMIRLVPLPGSEARDRYDLDEHGSYVEVTGPKANYSPMPPPMVFQRRAGGALEHVDLPDKRDVIDERVLAVLRGHPEALTREDWETACTLADPSVPKNKARESRKRLLAAQRIGTKDIETPDEDGKPGPAKRVFYAI